MMLRSIIAQLLEGQLHFTAKSRLKPANQDLLSPSPFPNPLPSPARFYGPHALAPGSMFHVRGGFVVEPMIGDPWTPLDTPGRQLEAPCKPLRSALDFPGAATPPAPARSASARLPSENQRVHKSTIIKQTWESFKNVDT